MSTSRAPATEKPRYEAFIRFCNGALAHMKDAIVGENLRPESDMQILFARNDPRLIKQEYTVDGTRTKYCATKLKPDVIVCSLPSARSYFNREGSWEDITNDDIVTMGNKAQDASASKSQKPIGDQKGWRGILSFAELKATGPIKSELKTVYKKDDASTNPPIFDKSVSSCELMCLLVIAHTETT
jgi:hypothetical protein